MWNFFLGLCVLLCYCFILQVKLATGEDFFESLLVRLECYPETRPYGCNMDFIDKFPNVSMSNTNATRATSHFYLFTPKNQDIPENLHKCEGKLPTYSNFDRSCPVVIYLPGFFSGICNFAIYREIKNEYFKRGCYNVILVDWMWGNSLDLMTAVINEKIVAHQVAILITVLQKEKGLTYKDFTLVGHSLGAHIAGFVGQEIRIGFIHGIDPAGVIVTKDTPLNDRLDQGDADFVQVTHCSAGQCLPGYFGVNFSCGHVDFWFNGGLHQPACKGSTFESFLKKDYIFATLSLIPAACSHFQCLQYYKAAIFRCRGTCQFIGVKCNSQKDFDDGKCRSCGENGENCAVMGPDTFQCLKDEQLPGQWPRNYYLNTGLKCPYCTNKGIDRGGFSCNVTAPKSSSETW